MALSDEVIARYGEQFLINLTNPDAEEETAIDTTRLAKAVLDVEGDFKTYGQVEYDGTSDQHVSLACEGVIIKLMVRAGEMKPKEEKAWRKEDLRDGLAMVTSRDRIMPASDSVLQPSSESRGSSSPVRPDFDRPRFDRVIVEHPGPGGDERVDE